MTLPPPKLDIASAASIFSKLPFFEKYKQRPPENAAAAVIPSTKSDLPIPDSELAYGSGKKQDDQSNTSPVADEQNERIRFPSTKDHLGRAPSTSSSYSSTSVLPVQIGGSLERSLSTPSETASPAAFAKDGVSSPLGQHPTRSKTTPSFSGRPSAYSKDQPTVRRRPEKQCVKCGKKITDGKWIQVDTEGSKTGTVLCEYDWKMLYLPKCRRCDKPIEGQAVGSSDGQIKGKYHRDCFNCTTCQVCLIFGNGPVAYCVYVEAYSPIAHTSFRNHSLTSHFTCLTVNRFANTTITKSTIHYALRPGVVCPSKARVLSRTMVTDIIQRTLYAIPSFARSNWMGSIGR